MSKPLVELVRNVDSRKSTVHAGRGDQTLCGWRFSIGKGGWILTEQGIRPEAIALPFVTCATCRSVIERSRKLEAP